MPLKSQGGTIKDSIFYKLAEFGKRSSEKVSVYGPFKIRGKVFATAAYYNRWAYWKWIILHPFYLVISFFTLKYYVKESSLAMKIRGILVFDEKANLILNKQLQKRVASVTLVWVDTYLTPVFPPKMFNAVDAVMKLEEKIFDRCKNRKLKKPTNLPEKIFFKELEKADKQVVKFYPIFKKYHASLKNARNLFNQVSNKPSDVNVKSLKNVIKNLSLNFEKLADWCEDRGKSWPDFVDSYELYKKSEERKKGLLKKIGSKFLWNRLLSIIIKIASSGNVVFSEACSMAGMFGIEGVKIILSFRWQTKSLKKSAKRYRDFSQRAKNFLDLFERVQSNDFLR